MDNINITTDMLLKAYSIGVFPMAEDHDDPEIFWINPRMRGILPFDNFHITKSLKKTIKKNNVEVTFNHAFEQVINGCAEETTNRPRTWINDKISELYIALHHMGNAHSVEVWQNSELVGGLYGVSLGKAFFGESMFSRISDASKIALVYLMARLNNAGFSMLDTQFTTKHLESFGAVEINRNDYLIMLNRAVKDNVYFDDNYKIDEIYDYLSKH